MTKVTTYVCDFCGNEEKQVKDWVIGASIVCAMHDPNKYNTDQGYTRTYAKDKDICPICAFELREAFAKAYNDFLERRN